ncbi:MAG: PAS domain S-box protein, partial [Thermodesulfobacteriota bacterium]
MQEAKWTQVIRELDELRLRNEELESMLIECKRAVDANTDMKSLYEVAQDLIELKRAEDALKKERDYFKNVLDNSADAIGIVDAKGRFIRWNKRAEELFGYSFEELRGKSAFDLYADQMQLGSMLESLRAKGFVRDTEVSIRTKFGHILPLGMSISLLREGERTIGSVCVARDLSQIKKTQAALQKSKEEAEAA